jgi:predicted Zn-dependent peptidase
MKAFYEKYYVGSNMGLVLCGDFDAETITPLLEKTFGRLPKGVKPVRGVSPLPDITAERTVEVKLPIPLVSAEALVFKAPTDYDKDANALKVALQMLSNGKAGMLDSLTNEGKMLMSAATTFSLNDAGAAAMIVIPNLLAKTAKAEAASLQQVQRLMAGDFSDESLLVQKQEIYRENARSLETIEERAMTMVEVMSSGHSWIEYIENV